MNLSPHTTLSCRNLFTSHQFTCHQFTFTFHHYSTNICLLTPPWAPVQGLCISPSFHPCIHSVFACIISARLHPPFSNHFCYLWNLFQPFASQDTDSSLMSYILRSFLRSIHYYISKYWLNKYVECFSSGSR